MSETITKACGDCKGIGYKSYDRGAYACETCNATITAPWFVGEMAHKPGCPRAAWLAGCKS